MAGKNLLLAAVSATGATLLFYPMLGTRHIDILNARLEATLPDRRILSFCEKLYGIKVDFIHQFYEVLGGDLWGIFPFSRDEILIYLFDFLGHDAEAAHKAVTMHSMISQSLHESASPSYLLEQINHKLRASPIYPCYATIFIGIYNARNHELSYANASGPPIYVVSNERLEPLLITAPSLPLGAIFQATYETHKVNLAINDNIVLYSDALTETRITADGNFFEPVFEEILKDYCHNKYTEQKLFDVVWQRFQTMCQGNVSDDLTYINININPDYRQ